ncbi:hypothetical protein B296_00042114 [Ensete ventricosum]|uniref:Protein-serine/threonine kinase n=1 Tax=Ensete ventricosum TaxID=4639 RepID=A0A426Z1F0_ENSVE|nr:hypothetical protein B296_00042114 [Ensete ventricosum]
MVLTGTRGRTKTQFINPILLSRSRSWYAPIADVFASRRLLFRSILSLVAMAVKKVAECSSKALAEEVQRWGAMKQNGVSLRYMMEFGARPTEKNLLLSAQFLHKELPVRIARRAIELESLPFGLSQKPAVLKVLPCAWFGVHSGCRCEVYWSRSPIWCHHRLIKPSIFDWKFRT